MEFLHRTQEELIEAATLAYTTFESRPDLPVFHFMPKQDVSSLRLMDDAALMEDRIPVIEIRRPFIMTVKGMSPPIVAQAAFWEIFSMLCEQECRLMGYR